MRAIGPHVLRMVHRSVGGSRNRKQHESRAGAANQTTACPSDNRPGADQMRKQFSNHREREGTLNDHAGAKSKPPRPYANRGKNVHSVKREFLSRFEDKIGKEDWEKLMKSAPPQQDSQYYLQNVRGEPEIVPKQ